MHDAIPDPGDELPAELADLLFDRLLEVDAAQQAAALDELCRRHPAHAVAMREQAMQLRFADAVLQRRGEEPDPGDPTTIGELRVLCRLGAGSFGVVYLCEQQQPIRRNVAVKVLRPGAGSRHTLARFEAERQVLALMSHPAIAHVIDAGALPDGRPFFVMEYVEGAPLTEWCDARRLTVAQRLELFLSLCDGVQHAHHKGVMHRDLKPSNVLVADVSGRAQPKIIDFGLAKALHQEAPSGIAATEVGHVLGTPGYMSPEQAEGRAADVDTRSDVFALGVILYEMLTGQLPRRDERESTRIEALRPSTWLRCLTGSTAAVASLRATEPRRLLSQVRGDLDWIALKAIEHDRERRYQSALDLADDLRRHLLHEPVLAGPPTTSYRFRKFCRRYRIQVAAGGAVLLSLVAGLATAWHYALEAQDSLDQLRLQVQETEAHRRMAIQRAEDVLSLSAAQDLRELVARADALWPVGAEMVTACEAWSRDARALIDGQAADPSRGIRQRPGLADHRRKLAELAARALPAEPSLGGAEQGAPPMPRFADRDDSWWHAQLTLLVADLEAFADPATGLCSGGTNPEHGWGVERRAEFARTLEHASLAGPEAAARWGEAIADVADPARCPRYGGLRLAPQLGLLPIGRDPRSGLWEFAHLPTGRPAERGPDGTVTLREGDGLVLVLVPAGSFWMGAQPGEEGGRNYDPAAQPHEGPVHEVSLAPFFLSKFEMTQDQWLRFTGRNPSVYGPGTRLGGMPTTLLHPVEQVSWQMATETLRRLGLVLPTEAQWEFAARAGADTPWWTGREPESLRGAANLADRFARQHGAPSTWRFEDWLDDGRAGHAPVGSYRANRNGLCDVAGNVYELCRDEFARYESEVRAGDGERTRGAPLSRMIRGGGSHSASRRARSAARTDVRPEYRDFGLGLRPARRVDG